VADLQHGEITPANHPSGNRGGHPIDGVNAVADEAARLTFVQTALDRGRAIYQLGGVNPGYYLLMGVTGLTQPIGLTAANAYTGMARRLVETGEVVEVPDNSVLFYDPEDFAVDGMVIVGDDALLSPLPIHGPDMEAQLIEEAPDGQLTFPAHERTGPDATQHLTPAQMRTALDVYSEAQVDALIAGLDTSFLPLSPSIYTDAVLPPNPLTRNVMTVLADSFLSPGPASVVLPTAAQGAVEGDFVGIQHAGVIAVVLSIDPQGDGLRPMDASSGLVTTPFNITLKGGNVVFRYIGGEWHPFTGTNLARFLLMNAAAPFRIEQASAAFGGEQTVFQLSPNTVYARDQLNNFSSVALGQHSLLVRVTGDVQSLSVPTMRVVGRSLGGYDLEALDDRRLWYILEMSNFEQVGPALGMVVNDLAFPGTSRIWRFTSVVAGCQLTGVASYSGNPDQPNERLLLNDSGTPIEWRHQNTGSAAANRIICPRGKTYRQQTGTIVRIRYNGSRWYLIPHDDTPNQIAANATDSAGIITIDLISGSHTTISLPGNRVVNFTGDLNRLAHRRGLIEVVQGSGGQLITDYQLNGSSVDVRHPGGVPPLLSAGASERDVLEWYYAQGGVVVRMLDADIS
jgi:hypothetical protein